MPLITLPVLNLVDDPRYTVSEPRLGTPVGGADCVGDSNDATYLEYGFVEGGVGYAGKAFAASFTLPADATITLVRVGARLTVHNIDDPDDPLADAGAYLYVEMFNAATDPSWMFAGEKGINAHAAPLSAPLDTTLVVTPEPPEADLRAGNLWIHWRGSPTASSDLLRFQQWYLKVDYTLPGEGPPPTPAGQVWPLRSRQRRW